MVECCHRGVHLPWHRSTESQDAASRARWQTGSSPTTPGLHRHGESTWHGWEELIQQAPTSLSLLVLGKNTLSKLKRKPACCSPRAAHNWVGMMPQTTKCSRWLQASSSLGWQSWNKRKTEGRECIFCTGLLGRGWTLAQWVHRQHMAGFQLSHRHTDNDQRKVRESHICPGKRRRKLPPVSKIHRRKSPKISSQCQP